eukprot:gnl/TRDRNA2_/TRDRNA2_40018_c0_seq1.p1 gnl/TRDRNA2_/TRDRNA2_40018_c0~~gnl/TRDRNA2_/TRDRNA2_40018_c0_seq1.p1  ORF type:complete len:158 (-),score=16.21 gnl/TRDRNA2_/TRDRNA2_40018_c0_seq1:263-685(-)
MPPGISTVFLVSSFTLVDAKPYMLGYFSDSECAIEQEDSYPEYFRHVMSTTGQACFQSNSVDTGDTSFSLTCKAKGRLQINWYDSLDCTGEPDDEEYMLSEQILQGACVPSDVCYEKIVGEIDPVHFPNCSRWQYEDILV